MTTDPEEKETSPNQDGVGSHASRLTTFADDKSYDPHISQVLAPHFNAVHTAIYRCREYYEKLKHSSRPDSSSQGNHDEKIRTLKQAIITMNGLHTEAQESTTAEDIENVRTAIGLTLDTDIATAWMTSVEDSTEGEGTIEDKLKELTSSWDNIKTLLDSIEEQSFIAPDGDSSKDTEEMTAGTM